MTKAMTIYRTTWELLREGNYALAYTRLAAQARRAFIRRGGRIVVNGKVL